MHGRPNQGRGLSMKNIAVIFAGGAGSRMKSKDTPKQFLKVNDKEIIIYTLEHFQVHPGIDGIVVVCIAAWIDYLNGLIERYQLSKVSAVVPGGASGQLSIYAGLESALSLYGDQCIVLVHDGVRPLINQALISANITAVKAFGSSITTSPAIETVIRTKADQIEEVIDRSQCVLAKAPQSFYLADLHHTHQQALKDGITNEIDSATLMSRYGFKLHTIVGPSENIKITTPNDFYMFESLVNSLVLEGDETE